MNIEVVARPSKRAKKVADDEQIELVQPNVGDRVYARFENGDWYWGVATQKFYKEDGCLYYSIQYDDGDFVEEHKASDGIATEQQYGWKESEEVHEQGDDITTQATVLSTPPTQTTRSTTTPNREGFVTPDEGPRSDDDIAVPNPAPSSESVAIQVRQDVTPETSPSHGNVSNASDGPTPDPAPSSSRAEEVRRDVFHNFGMDSRVKEEGCASTLSEEEREKRKKCLDKWIQANTDPRTGNGRYVFRRGCHKKCMTKVLGGHGVYPWPKVENPPMWNGEPNPFISKGDFYVAGNEEWNFFGPRFPGDTGLVNLAAFKENPQSTQKEFHLFVQCSKHPHKRHWHGKEAEKGRMYVGVYRKVVDEEGDDDAATIVHMDDPDLEMDSRLGISAFHLKWRLGGNKDYMTTDHFQRCKLKAKQKAGEDWYNYSNNKQNNLSMYERLVEVDWKMETVPVEFVRYDEDLYQALVDFGAVARVKDVPKRVALTPEALHHWY